MNARFVAYTAIVAAGVLAGALWGTACGPEVLEVPIDGSSALGAGAGGLLAAIGCCFAVEWNVARARNRATVAAMEQRLTRLVGMMARAQ